MATSDFDFQPETWWEAPTVSGGTISGSENFWWGDYTRHRSGGLEPTYLSPDDIIGRNKSVADF